MQNDCILPLKHADLYLHQSIHKEQKKKIWKMLTFIYLIEESLWSHVKMHGYIVLYLLIDQAPLVLMPGSRTFVLGVSCMLDFVCTTVELDCPELWKCEFSVISLCLQFRKPQIVSPTSHVPVDAAHASKCKKYYRSLFYRMLSTENSQLSCEDLFGTWVTPQYRLWPQLMVLQRADSIHTIMWLPYREQCIHSNAEATNLFFLSVLKSLFFICYWKPRVWLKLG